MGIGDIKHVLGPALAKAMQWLKAGMREPDDQRRHNGCTARSTSAARHLPAHSKAEEGQSRKAMRMVPKCVRCLGVCVMGFGLG